MSTRKIQYNLNDDGCVESILDGRSVAQKTSHDFDILAGRFELTPVGRDMDSACDIHVRREDDNHRWVIEVTLAEDVRVLVPTGQATL